MKKALVILVIALLFLGIFAAVLYKVIAPVNTPPKKDSVTLPNGTTVSTTAVGTTSGDFAEACMGWYVNAFAKLENGESPDNYDKGLSACFTDAFIESWDAIRDDTGVDAVLSANDYKQSWLSVQTAGTARDTDTGITVPVTLGSGSEATHLTVYLTQTASGLRIADVIPAN